MADSLKRVKFLNSQSYEKFYPRNMLIYCDPPYENNSYSTKTKFFEFDSKKFWETMRKWSKSNIVVISENNAPKDFIKIWCEKLFVRTNCHNTIQNECLFIHNSIYNMLSAQCRKDLTKI